MNSFFKMHLFFFQESPGSRHDWNKDYVVLIERLRNFKNSTSYQEKIEVYSKISTLYSNFIYSAQTYGKVIIEEAYLPDNQKLFLQFQLELLEVKNILYPIFISK